MAKATQPSTSESDFEDVLINEDLLRNFENALRAQYPEIKNTSMQNLVGIALHMALYDLEHPEEPPLKLTCKNLGTMLKHLDQKAGYEHLETSEL